MRFERWFYIGLLAFCIAFIALGNMLFTGGLDIETEELPIYSAVVTAIDERIEWRHELSDEFYIDNILVIFEADAGGDIVVAEQSISTFLDVDEREVRVGDRVLLLYDSYLGIFFFMDYVRANYIAILGVVFLLSLAIFARKKGVNAILALGFTCGAIFLVFVPSILSGYNIFVMTLVTAAFCTITTLLMVIGPSRKAVSAISGCLGGLLLAGLLMLVMDSVLNMVGFIDQETRFLLNLPTEVPINLSGIIFAGVLIGSTGAIMDVAMSISSAIWELRQSGFRGFRDTFASGLEIGKDIMGTMLNTLILAYIGSSLSLILLVTADSASPLQLFNSEMIVVEFLRALVGGFGMLLAIPITAATASISKKITFE